MLDWLFEIARTSPVAHALGLLALVCAAGMALGSLKVKGIGLGSSGVLFMGILAAQFSQPADPRLLTFVSEFGLVLFVFTMGLSLGPGFFASLRAEGLRLNMLAAVLVLSAGLLAPLVGWLGGFDPEAIGGLFAGATTNTPALGAAQQSLASMPGISPERLALPALACAVAYPGSIVGSLAVILLLKVLFRIDPVKEAELYAAERRAKTEPLARRTLVVENAELAGTTVAEACRRVSERIVICRIRRAGQTEVQTASSGAALEPRRHDPRRRHDAALGPVRAARRPPERRRSADRARPGHVPPHRRHQSRRAGQNRRRAGPGEPAAASKSPAWPAATWK